MPKTYYDTPFSVPKPASERTTKSVPNDANKAFLDMNSTLLDRFGCPGGPFKHMDRVYILDKKGQFTTPQNNLWTINNMEAAAIDGRLFFRDRQNYIHQISLKQNNQEEYDLHVSEPISKTLVPPRPKFYFIKSILALFSSVFRGMIEAYNDLKKFDEAMDEFVNTNKYKLAPPKIEPLVPEEPKETEVEEKQPEIKEPEVQVVEEKKTVEELLAMNPTQMTTNQFADYLEALDKRGDEGLVNAVMDDKNTMPADYYEAVAQEMEGEIAREVRVMANGKINPEKRIEFLEQQKPVMASLSQGLRKFVQEKADQNLINDYFAARADGVSTSMLKIQVLMEVTTIRGSMSEYLKEAKKQNEANRKMQQPQPTQVQQPKMETKPLKQEQPKTLSGL